jgi:hypothetical protein
MKKYLCLFVLLAFAAAVQAKTIDPNDPCFYTDGTPRNASGCHPKTDPIVPGQKDVPGSEGALKACEKGSKKCRCESTGGVIPGC